jgi:hypothetical protein
MERRFDFSWRHYKNVEGCKVRFASVAVTTRIASA